MFRRLLSFAFALILAAPAFAACDLSMTMSCSNGQCTAVTTNNAGSACSGILYSLWFTEETPDRVRLGDQQTSVPLDLCFDSEEFGEAGADIGFAFCYGSATIGAGSTFTSTVKVSGAAVDAPLVAMTWVGDEEGNEYGSAFAFSNVTAPSCTPTISAPPVSPAGSDYTVSWTAVSDPTAQFLVEESTSADFSSNVTQSQVNGLSKTYRHDNLATTTTYYYRVRATNCTGGQPETSRVAQTVVQATPAPVSDAADVAVPFGSTNPVSFPVFIPGQGGKTATFTATMDQPYLTVTPSSGTLPPQGITLTVTANPTALPAGANTGTLQVFIETTTSNLAGGSGAAGTTLNIPISISLVTPVAPGSKTTPPANALVIPVVTHVNGAAGPFLSDVRLTNAGSTATSYQITMTPTQTDGTKSSKVTMVTVDGQQTVALNDVVKNFFGFGATSNPQDVGFGSLEIRPLNTSSNATFASSRTYASTAGGTFGQFIAAMPFTKFATRRTSGFPLPGGGEAPFSSSLLSLQHVAQSSKFRTNLGIVEGAGEAASGKIRVFNALGTLLKEVDYSLLPGEHRQMNRFIELNAGIPSLENGRIEITVDSPTGAVTAYASVLDNETTDPLAVMPVETESIRASRYVVPGMAELPNGQQNFHSDVRLFNGGASDTTVSMTFYPQGNGTPVTAAARPVRKGEVLVLDNVLPSVFGVNNGGGSVVFTTPEQTSLVATGRTYTNVERNGTYGQFIPGVTPEEGVGGGERPLQVMQLEESSQFRSNVGLAELTGNSATVRLTLHLPDSKVTAVTELTLAPNEFRQLRPIAAMNPGKQTYNARISVEVIAGAGRVTAYGSVIDNESKDPTYVPAQ